MESSQLLFSIKDNVQFVLVVILGMKRIISFNTRKSNCANAVDSLIMKAHT